MKKRISKPVAIVILIVILVGGFFIVQKLKNSKSLFTGNAPSGSYQLRATPTPVYTLYAKESSLLIYSVKVGSEVDVEAATLALPGYVVVYTVKDDLPDLVIGHSDLLKGKNTNIKIKVNHTLSKGQKIFVGLNSDDGNGQFEYPGHDIPIFGNDKNPYGFVLVVN